MKISKSIICLSTSCLLFLTAAPLASAQQITKDDQYNIQVLADETIEFKDSETEETALITSIEEENKIIVEYSTGEVDIFTKDEHSIYLNGEFYTSIDKQRSSYSTRAASWQLIDSYSGATHERNAFQVKVQGLISLLFAWNLPVSIILVLSTVLAPKTSKGAYYKTWVYVKGNQMKSVTNYYSNSALTRYVGQEVDIRSW